MPDEPTPTPGTAVYGELVKEEIAAQETRKSSFEQRGLAVVTTTGALVTLLFGLAAIASRTGHGEPFGTEEKWWLAVALIGFVVSAFAALATNIPVEYESVKPSDITGRLTEAAPNNAEQANRDIALTQITVLEHAKKKNALKGKFLFGAMLFEVLGVIAAGVAIFEVINP
jgi:hypothetical protein